MTLLITSLLAAAALTQAPAYEAGVAVEFYGTVEAVQDVRVRDRIAGVHLIVRVKKETCDVYVAPTRFLKELGIKFALDARIKVTGSKIKAGNAEVVLARQISWDDGSSLIVRDRDGTPFWTVSDAAGGLRIAGSRHYANARH